ncbi:MAG TPA: hypothetical protein VGM88_17865 [Kofleriaceae bacterium]|jgi:hypothetical protein
MRLVLLVLLAASCSVDKNPDVCCATADQCTSLGLDPTDLRPCGAGQACNADHACVAAECTTSDTCPSSSPVCANGLCAATCTADPDCPTALPHCDMGACVACADDSQCPAAAAICDASTHACRGCTADAECTSGVCIEDTGVCAAAAEIIYVGAYAPANDTGECPSAAPCSSIAYAFTKLSASRDVIRLTAETAYLGDSGARLIAGDAFIDGKPTLLSGPSLGVAGANLTVENATYTAAAQALVATDVGSLTLSHATITLSAASSISVDMTSTLKLHDTDVTGPGIATHAIACDTSSLVYLRSVFHGASSESMTCDEQVSRSRFFDSKLRGYGGGHVQVDNVLVVSSAGDDDIFDTKEAAPGSWVRFATFVNQSPVTQSQAALYCSDNVDVSSVVFAFNSRDPIDSCTAHDSLFDTPSSPDPFAAGNDIEDASTFFLDAADGNYHLGASSPALGHGEPGLETEDLEGNPRGATPDIGAYEAP